jgi:hypothetical protein
MSDSAVATESRQVSRWEDYVDVFFSPAELFRRRADDRVAPPLITLLVLAVVVYALMSPANAIAMRAAIADNPEAAAGMSQMGSIFLVIGGILVPITFLAVIAASAALLWAAARLVDVRAAFSRTMLIATYAAFVYLLSQLAGGVATLIHGEAGFDLLRHTSFGPLRFTGDGMNPVVMALLRRLDVFAIWQAVLWGVGVAVVFRASRFQAAATAAAAWILFAIPNIVAAALGFGPGASGG